MARPGQPMIQNYMPNQMHLNQQRASTSDGKKTRKGRFGWAEFERNPIPYIFRASGEKTEKYISVRMVERKLLNKFLSVLPTEVNSW